MTVKKALKEILSKVYFVEIAGCVTLLVRCANTLESIVAYPSDSYLKRRCTYVEVFFKTHSLKDVNVHFSVYVHVV